MLSCVNASRGVVVSVCECGRVTCVRALDVAAPRVCVRAALPRAPIGVTVSDVTAVSARVAWLEGGAEPAHAYVIQYRARGTLSSGFFEVEVIAPSTEHTVVGLSAYTSYEFRVLALNSIGRSLPSTSVEATTGELGMYKYVLMMLHDSTIVVVMSAPSAALLVVILLLTFARFTNTVGFALVVD